MSKESNKFVKVCFECLSTKLSVRIFDVGHYYDCNECNAKSFFPMEFLKNDLPKARELLAKTLSKSKIKAKKPKSKPKSTKKKSGSKKKAKK